jgi:serine protease inhibitor
MHARARFLYAANEKFQVLELPYSSNRLSMMILLPKRGVGMAEVEKTLTAAQIEQLHRTCRPQELSVVLPRFKSASEFRLDNMLKAMGMRNAFIMSAADFSGITEVKPFFIEAIIHKALVEVNEEGTEAAAATGVFFADSVSIAFNADHPFMFLIRHNPTATILFMGRVVNPAL